MMTTENEDEFRPDTEGELIIMALDLSAGDFWDALERASEEGLREALQVLQAPHPDDKTDPRIAQGIEQIEDALEKRSERRRRAVPWIVVGNVEANKISATLESIRAGNWCIRSRKR
jgi:type VI protein secretion system component VasK